MGSWAHHVVVRGDWVVPGPPTVTPTAAVCMAFDYAVAYQMLTRSTRAHRGDTVLFQGVGGGVGTAFMQLARDLGVRTLGTDREAKRSHVETQGTTIDFEREDVVQRCRAVTGGRGVDYAYDGIGGTARASLRALRPGGRLVWFGMITMLARGARDWPAGAKLLGTLAGVCATNLRPRGKRASPYSIQQLARRHPDWYREDVATLMGMLGDGRLAPQIAAVLALDEVPAALADLVGHGPPGKQVVAVAPPSWSLGQRPGPMCGHGRHG